MKRKNVFLLVSIFGGLFLLGAVFLTINWRQALEALAGFSAEKFFLFFLMTAVTVHLHAFRHRMILRYYRQNIGFYKILAVRLIGFAVSYLVPSASLAGEPLRAHVLVKSGVDAKIGYASVILDKFWELAPNFIFQTALVILALFSIAVPVRLLAVIIVVIATYLAAFYIFYTRSLRGHGTVSGLFRLFRIGSVSPAARDFGVKIEEAEEEVTHFLKKRPAAFIKLVMLTPLVYFSGLAEFWLLAYLLGFQLSFFGAVAVQFFLTIATVVPVSAGLGVSEFGGASAFLLLGLKSFTGLAFTILWRLKDLIYACLGLIFLAFYGKKKAS